MNISRFLVFVLLSFQIPAFAAIADLTDCLNAGSRGHRIEKEDNLRSCFERFKSSITKEQCDTQVQKKVMPMSSLRLSEDIRSLCFYDTTPPKDMESCMRATRQFKISGNHDEAVFFCYQEFHEKLSKADCLKTARQLIFPAKQDYLKQHCTETADLNY